MSGRWLGLVMVLAACNSQTKSGVDTSGAIVELGDSRVPTVLGGYSIKVAGTRNGDADPFYMCADSFSVCLTVAPDGSTSIAGGPGVGGLCATSFTNAPGDTGDGKWRESCQAAFRAGDCDGTPLADIACVVNDGQEADLEPGANYQHIVITETDASKIFDVSVCTDDGLGHITCTPNGNLPPDGGVVTQPDAAAVPCDAAVAVVPDGGIVNTLPDAAPDAGSIDNPAPDSGVVVVDAPPVDAGAAPSDAPNSHGTCDAATAAAPDAAAPSCPVAVAHAHGNALGAGVTFLNNLQLSTAASGQDGVGTNQNSDHLVPQSPDPSKLSLGVLDTSSVSTVSADAASASSSASALDVNLFDGMITVDVLRAVADAHAGAGGATVDTDGSLIEGLAIAGVAIQTAQVNARVELPLGLGYVVINEVVSSTADAVDSNGSTADVVVNLIHVHLDNPLDGAIGDIIVSHALAHADFTPAATCP